MLLLIGLSLDVFLHDNRELSICQNAAHYLI
jgi:hypothetical protein